jgi:hypothetical protein
MGFSVTDRALVLLFGSDGVESFPIPDVDAGPKSEWTYSELRKGETDLARACIRSDHVPRPPFINNITCKQRVYSPFFYFYFYPNPKTREDKKTYHPVSLFSKSIEKQRHKIGGRGGGSKSYHLRERKM